MVCVRKSKTKCRAGSDHRRESDADVEEYRNQHQPTPLLDFLRHVKDTRLGAPSIGAYGENG